MPLGDLYREIIMDHSRHPRNRGSLEDPTFRVGLNNPTCGDEIVLDVTLDDAGRIDDVRFQGQGCTISMAAASMMTEAVRGKPIAEARRILAEYKSMLVGKGEADEDLLGELALLKGVTQFPMRIKCASLAFTALEQGLNQNKEEVHHGQD